MTATAPTRTRRRMNTPNTSIFSDVRTGTSPSERESTFASAISLLASKAYVPSKPYSLFGRDCGWRWSRLIFAGGSGPACGRSKACRLRQTRGDGRPSDGGARSRPTRAVVLAMTASGPRLPLRGSAAGCRQWRVNRTALGMAARPHLMPVA
jgi:hypothetical protein